MTGWSYRKSCPRGDHLPPASVTPYLYELSNGKRRAKDTLELPETDLHVPMPLESVNKVLETVDATYEWPTWTNIHHFCYPRRSYESEIELAYRESPTLKAMMPIQLYSCNHRATGETIS